MLKEFRDFILRGNVVELATAVVIGVAFQAVVDAIVSNLIQPLIAVLGGDNINGLSVQLLKSNEATIIDFGAVISALISFLVTALVVFFFFVRPFSRIAQQFAAKPEEPAKPDDVALLEEIRDILRSRNTV